MTLSLPTDSHHTTTFCFIFYNTSLITIFIHWNNFKNKQEVAALKLRQHFNNDRQRKYLKVVCNKCARTEAKFQISWTNTSPRLLFPSSFVQCFYLGLNLFSGAYWRGNRKSIYSKKLIKLHNQNRKMCFCKNYGVLNHSHFRTNTRI